jgi:hypothetical protein
MSITPHQASILVLALNDRETRLAAAWHQARDNGSLALADLITEQLAELRKLAELITEQLDELRLLSELFG